MMAWTLDVENWAGSVVHSDVPFRNLGVTWQLNAPGAIEVALNISELPVGTFSPRKHILVLKRDGTKVWAGPYMTSRIELTQDNAHSFIAIGEGYYTVLRHIYIQENLNYNDVNMHTIMRNLITYAQSKSDAAFGITLGSHTGSDVPVDRDYCALELPNVAEGIDELTQHDDGSDWVIGPCISFSNDRQFRTYNPRRGSDLSGTVQLGQGVASRFSFEVDAQDMANYVITRESDDCNPREYITSNTGSLTNRKRSERVDEIDTGALRDLRSHGNEVLNNFMHPTWHGDLMYYAGNGPDFGSYDVGDIVQVTSFVDGYGTFDESMRIISIHAELSPPSVRWWNVELDSVVE